jgi:hypothetical protein
MFKWRSDKLKHKDKFAVQNRSVMINEISFSSHFGSAVVSIAATQACLEIRGDALYLHCSNSSPYLSYNIVIHQSSIPLIMTSSLTWQIFLRFTVIKGTEI